jgi:hypothetical protein
MKKLLSLLLLCAFLVGLGTLALVGGSSAEAKAKKKVVHKIKKVKKTKKKARKAKRATVKKAAVKKAPATASPAPDRYALPPKTGVISQKYSLVEGIGEAEADKLVSDLKAFGVSEANVDVNSNVLSVKFNSGELTSISIIKKLRGLGYGVRQID